MATQRRRASSVTALGAGAAWLVLALSACLIYNEDLLVDDDGSCEVAADCAGGDTTCSTRACRDGICAADFAAATTPCSEAGGQVCNGTGSCVECVDETQCGAGQSCSSEFVCQQGLAENGAPCSQGLACQSGFCTDGRCCESVCGGACVVCDAPGSEGTCTNVAAGDNPNNECGNDVCNGAGACRCGDMMTNGQETDVDCGGGTCGGCSDGEMCSVGTDCISGFCPAGTCQQNPVCGNNQPDPNEDCDDGNTEPFDGCSGSCLDPTTHLIISEIVVTPTDGEYVEIYNPTNSTVSLDTVYLADFATYYLETINMASHAGSDFVAQFPPGSMIGPRAFVVVATKSATQFQGIYSVFPDYDFSAADTNAPAMIGSLSCCTSSNSGMSNSDEMLVLFQWNGVSDLVTDLDYVVWGNTSDAMDKSGQVVGSSTYAAETAAGLQNVAPAPPANSSVHRCDTAEATETKSGGNGSSGHDETSEDLSTVFKLDNPPSPGGPPTLMLCP